MITGILQVSSSMKEKQLSDNIISGINSCKYCFINHNVYCSNSILTHYFYICDRDQHLSEHAMHIHMAANVYNLLLQSSIMKRATVLTPELRLTRCFRSQNLISHRVLGEPMHVNPMRSTVSEKPPSHTHLLRSHAITCLS